MKRGNRPVWMEFRCFEWWEPEDEGSLTRRVNATADDPVDDIRVNISRDVLGRFSLRAYVTDKPRTEEGRAPLDVCIWVKNGLSREAAIDEANHFARLFGGWEGGHN